MTTGNLTQNGRYKMTGPAGSGTVSLTVGKYYSRAWTGTQQTVVTSKRTYKFPSGIATYTWRRIRRVPKPPSHLGLTAHPYRVYWDEEDRAIYVLTKNNGAYRQSATGPGWTTALPQTVDIRDTYKVIAKLRQQIYGNAWNPAVSLAEGRQTLSLIYNSAVRIGAGLHYLRSGQWGKLRQVFPNRIDRAIQPRNWNKPVRSISDAVVEFQYGVKPLINDVQDAATWLAATLDPSRAQPARYVARSTKRFSGKVSPNTSLPYVYFLNQEVTQRIQVIANVTSVASPLLPNIWTISEALWEITPWSFIGDWFIPIGSYLEAMKLRSAVRGEFITSTRVSQAGDTLTWNRLNDQGYTGGYPYVGTNTANRGWFERVVSTELIVPRPCSFRNVGDALSMERTVNAVALVGQRRWSTLAEIWENLSTSLVGLRPSLNLSHPRLKP